MKQVSAGIIICNDRILIARRSHNKSNAALWEFPGGKLQEGETAREAIVREIAEELRVKIEPESLLTTVEYDYETFHLTMHCFVSQIIEGEFVLVEHEALRWLAPDELDSVDWLPADVEVVEALKRHPILRTQA